MARLLYIPIPLNKIHGFRELECDQFGFLITVIADSILMKDDMYYTTSISALVDDEEMLKGPDLTKLELYYLEIADNIYLQLEPVLQPLIPLMNMTVEYVSTISVKGNYVCLEIEESYPNVKGK